MREYKAHATVARINRLGPSDPRRLLLYFDLLELGDDEAADFIRHHGGGAVEREAIEYTEVRNFAQGEEEWASHRDSATMDVA